MDLRHVGFPLWRWPLSFSTFHAALRAQFQVFFLVFRANGFSSSFAERTGFSATFFLAEACYVTADIFHVFRLQHSAVRAHQKA